MANDDEILKEKERLENEKDKEFMKKDDDKKFRKATKGKSVEPQLSQNGLNVNTSSEKNQT